MPNEVKHLRIGVESSLMLSCIYNISIDLQHSTDASKDVNNCIKSFIRRWVWFTANHRFRTKRPQVVS